MSRGRKKGSKSEAWTAKATFWNKQRVMQGYTVDELAETIGLGSKATASYLTGFIMPNDEIIKEFCNLFQIDFMKGKGEFAKANAEYPRSEKSHKCKMRASKPDMAPAPEVKPEVEVEPVPVKKPIVNADNRADRVMELLYNIKIPYKDFKILAGQLMSGADILECTYGKVDFDTFAKIVGIANS